MSVGSVWDLSSDAELITAVRSGETAAFGVLYERHSSAAHSVARQYSNSAADADDAVQDAFSRVFAAIQGGGGPDVAFRAYLFTVLRRVALDRVDSVRKAEPTDDLATFEAVSIAEESSEQPTMEGFERGVVSQAYGSLPERWQAVLWYTEVEGLSAAEIAPILGLTANGVAALAYRAREGLRQAYLQQHLTSPASEACTLVNSKLGAYVRGGLAKRETLLVESHLDECRQCRALVLELGDVNHGMRAVIAPFVLGGVAVAVIQGIGFGGAVAAAKGVGLAAGAAGGSAAGAGAGGAAGGAGGQGVGAGAGAGAASGGTAGAGAAGGAVGAAASAAGVAGVAGAAVGGAVLAGSVATPAAAADAAGGAAGAAGGAGAAAVGAGAAAAGTAGAAGAGATGVLAAVFGAIAGSPLLLGVVAGLVVVAASVGVAGVMGAFSGPDETVSASATADGAADPSDEGSPGPEPEASEPSPDAPGPDAADPAESADLGASNPGASDTSGASASPTPYVSEPGPPPAPVIPDVLPALSIDPVAEVALVSGVPSPVDVVVHNDTDTAAHTVSTDITFGPGVTWSVEAVPVPAGFGAAVPTGRTGWSCARVDETTARCTLAVLPAHSSTTLRALIAVTDDSLDGHRDLGFAISTGVKGGPRSQHEVTTQLASPAAFIEVVEPDEVSVIGELATDATAETLVEVHNEGGTSVTEASVRVSRPSDLPSGVQLDAGDASWSCVPDGDDLVCTVARLARKSKISLPVRLTVPALHGAQDPVLDTDMVAGVVVTSDDAEATARVAVASAPGQLEVAVDPQVAVDARIDGTVTADVSNVGGTTLTALTSDVTLPAGASVTGPSASGDWACAPAADLQAATCELDELAPGSSSTMQVGLRAEPNAESRIEINTTSGAGRVERTTALKVRVPELGIAEGFSADLVVGASGTVALEVTNDGDGVAAGVTVHLELPPGTSFDRFGPEPGPVGAPDPHPFGPADWQCTTSDREATCTLGTLGAGDSAALILAAYAGATVDGNVVATVGAGNTDAAPTEKTVAVRVAYAGLSPRGRWTGGYDAQWIGAPSLGCTGCGDAMTTFSGEQNNHVTMVPIDAVATLDNADVVFAGLYWSGNRHLATATRTTDPWSSSLTQVTLVAPDGTSTAVNGERIADVTDNGNREYYQSFADVTSQVLAGGAGAWQVDDVAYAREPDVADRSYYAGWTMVVVYADASAGDVTLYDGGAWVAQNSEVMFKFAAGVGTDAVIGVTAWDGDQGNTGDRAELNDHALTPIRADGTSGSSNDAFNSTASGSSLAGHPILNSLGVDAKAFGWAAVTGGINELVFSTGGDQYLVGAVTVATATRPH